MTHANPTAGLAPPPDPPQDRSGKPMPEGIAWILAILHPLLACRRHLEQTLQHRATLRTFSVIAQCFGTRQLPYIAARVARGILRAVALERVLLARARRGRDLAFHDPDQYRPRKPRPPAQPAAGTKPPRRHRRTRPDPDECLSLDTRPSLEELEKEVRRRGIGRALAAICCDLGIHTVLCDSDLSIRMWQARTWYGSNGVYHKYYRKFLHRELDFAKGMDRTLRCDLEWPTTERTHIREVLGFFVGEAPVWPAALAAVSGAVPGATTVPP